MRSKRPAILMAILLILVLGYVAQPVWERYKHQPQPTAVASPLPGTNIVSHLKVYRDDTKGRWIADFDYFYTGAPTDALLNIELSKPGNAPETASKPRVSSGGGPAKRGEHHASMEIDRPFVVEETTSRVVVVRLEANGKTLAMQEVAQAIAWSDYATWMRDRELGDKGHVSVLNSAVALIDKGTSSSLREAKAMLERIVDKDARYVPAYIELARVAMKTNWGTEGLHQAETLLASALQIQPDSINAKVLLGYVYAHQGRFGQAEKLFAEAVNAGTSNLWAWSNWGESLALRGKSDEAITKYREGLGRPRTDAPNDSARMDAYSHLLILLERRKDFSGMEDLHKRRAEEFGPLGCFSADYSQFILQQRGDAPAAIAIARPDLSSPCGDSKVRKVLGLAYYVAWATDTGSHRLESLNQARVYLPAGPSVLYLLAGSDRTIDAAKQLIASGESIEQHDNYKLNALAYALQNRDYAAARRLIRLGARTDAKVSEGEMPVALIPVMSGDIEGIRVMQKSGVDYSKVRYQGTTAIDQAKRSGDRQLLDTLNPKGQVL
jgi:tetratricopeptide (TPR) repeat protein